MSPITWQIHSKDQTVSTNDDIKQLALQGHPEGTVVTAESQTAGRGRRGNPWFSPPGRNLICSLLLRPDYSMDLWSRLTHATALAIAQSLEPLGFQPKIKWPNDMFLSHRKVCGILLETAGNSREMFVVIGFGLNVNLSSEEFPPELADLATSLHMESERSWDRVQLLQSILHHIALHSRGVVTAFPEILKACEERSYLTGKRISVTSNNTTTTGIAQGLSPEGGLLLKTPSGSVQEFLTADQVRPLESVNTAAQT